MDKEAIIREANEALITRGEVDKVSQYFTTGYVAHEEGREHSEHEYIERFITIIRNPIPDVTVSEVQILMNDRDKVAWRREANGTHTHDLLGIPPTGRQAHWEDLIVSRFEGNKIAEEWGVSDLAGRLMMHLPRK